MTNAVTLDLSSLDNLLYTVSPAPLRERGGRMGKSETYRKKGGEVGGITRSETRRRGDMDKVRGDRRRRVGAPNLFFGLKMRYVTGKKFVSGEKDLH